MEPQDTLESVLAEFAAIAQARTALDERYTTALARLEAVTVDGIRQRLYSRGEGLLMVAVETTSHSQGNASLGDRALDWFSTAAQGGVVGAKTGSYVKAFRTLP